MITKLSSSILCIILIAVGNYGIIQSLPTIIRHRKDVQTLHLENCWENEDLAKKTSYISKYTIVIRPVGGSLDKYPKEREKYKWSYKVRRSSDLNVNSLEIFDIEKFVSEHDGIIKFPPQSILPGLYEISPTVVSRSQESSPKMEKCFFLIEALAPIAYIEGGTYSAVQSNTVLTLHANNSRDLNTAKPKLKFQWTCYEVCADKRLPTNGATYSVTVPKNLPKTNNKFRISLKVTSEFGMSDVMNRDIEIIDSKTAYLVLRCEKNCRPLTNTPNVAEKTIFNVECEKNCHGVSDKNFEWTIILDSDSAFDFDYAGNTETGRRGKKFVIAANALKSLQRYNLAVALKDFKFKGRAQTTLEFGEKVQVRNCQIKPAITASPKDFTFRCEELTKVQESFFYEFFIGDTKGKIVLSGYSPNVFRSSFLLSKFTGKKYTTRVFFKHGESLMQVAVRAQIEYEPPSEQSIAKLLSAKNMKDKQKGVQKFLDLADEYIMGNVRVANGSKILEDFKQIATEDLLNKRNEGDVDELVKTADNIYNLKKDPNFGDPHPVLSNFVSLLCSRVLNTFSKKIEKNHTIAARHQTTALANVLAQCFEFGSKPNYDILQPVKKLVIEQPPLVHLEPALTENYPDYVDYSSEYGEHMENLKKHTSNVIASTAKVGKLLAKSMKTGEHNVTISGLESATVVFKDIGKIASKSRIDVLDCELFPSKDFANSDNSFDVLMSTWLIDLMWWNHRKTRVATSVLSIQSWYSTGKKQIRHFKTPASVSLKIKENIHLELNATEGKITVPQNYKKLSGKALNSHIRIYRVSVPKRTVLNVNFLNVSINDSIDVVTTFHFPSYEDFSKPTTFPAKNYSTLIVTNSEPNDLWCYVAILPSKTSTSINNIIKFNMTFTTSSCITWDLEKAFWKPTCKPGKTNTIDKIHCECKHFSVLAGYKQSALSLPQKIIHPNIVLELQSCYVIFITVAVTFGLYCLLLITVAAKIEEEIYYLADNAKEDSYAYILIVRTENASSAGTTSNVVVKLTGTKRSSVPHVLNYPDPKMRLLQKQGKDIFVLTTPGHLGDLTKIELWYNCEGASPSWYCRDILVYDMQNRSECYFKIKSRFDISKGVVYVEKAANVSEEANLPFCKRFSICNHFHTWQVWAGEKNFRFMAKLTTILSTVLMIYMFVLMLQGVPSMEIRDCLDPYPYFRLDGYTIFAALTSSFLSFIIHVTLAWFFRFSDIQFRALKKEYKKSHNLNWVCWILLSIMIGLSTSFLIIYGFWVPTTSSHIWLVASIIGIVFDVVILENVLIAFQTYYCKFRLRYAFDEKFDKFVKVIEGQRAVLYQRFDGTLLRSFLKNLYRPLRPIQILRRKVILKLRRSIVDDLEDLFMYGIYNIILHFVILYNKAPFTLINKSEVQSMLEGKHLRTLSFSKVASIEQIYTYINQTLIPSMQPTAWYNDYAINSPGMMIDYSNKFIGVARLRQHRVGPESCSMAPVMKFLKLSCWPEFNGYYEEIRSLGSGWQKSKAGMEYDRMHYVWEHKDSSYTGTLGSMGEFTTYSGGGYVAFLGRTLYNSYSNLLRLYETYWIDHKSRGIYIEFLTYNVNYNIFSAVQLLFEQSATGYVEGTVHISTVRMLLVHNELEIMTMVVFGLYVGWMMMLMLKLSVGIIRNIRTFYKKVWLMLDLVINIMSLLCIIMFVIRMKMVEQLVKALEEKKHNQFMNYFTLFYVEDFLTCFSSILICIATCRLWRFLRFGLFFRILERTLSMASFPLFAVSLSFFVMVIGFGLTGLLIFGNFFPELSTLMKISATLIQLTLKPEDYPLVEYAVEPIGYAYFTLYLMLMQVILFIYVVVIIMAYTKAQLEFSTEPDSYTVNDYIRERIEYYPKLLKYKFRRMRGGAFELDQTIEKRKPVTAKADEFRYANCLGVPKSQMKAMKFVTSCVIRNMAQTSEDKSVLTRHEINLMLRVCNQFVLKIDQDDEFELFFKGHFEGENFRLVDEKRITKIAEFVELLLEGTSAKAGKASATKVEKIMNSTKSKLGTLRNCNLQLKFLSCVLDSVDKEFTRVLEL